MIDSEIDYELKKNLIKLKKKELKMNLIIQNQI